MNWFNAESDHDAMDLADFMMLMTIILLKMVLMPMKKIIEKLKI